MPHSLYMVGWILDKKMMMIYRKESVSHYLSSTSRVESMSEKKTIDQDQRCLHLNLGSFSFAASKVRRLLTSTTNGDEVSSVYLASSNNILKIIIITMKLMIVYETYNSDII